MKFIHTSDWHIGRQFHNVSLLEDQKHILGQIVDYLKEHEVDALVIAGDIYDRSIPPSAAVELLDELLHHICMDLQVPIVLIPGNHDSAERVRFGARQLSQAGLHILGSLSGITQPVVLQGPHGEVHFHGIPYNDPEHVRSVFAAELEKSGEEIRNHEQAHAWLVNRIHAARSQQHPCVLVSHCFVDGSEESESERPLSVGGADRVSWLPLADFDYVALGHLHSPQHQGTEHIRYSGSIMKYSFSEEKQRKGVTLVEMDAQRNVKTRHLPLKPLRDLRILEGMLDDILAQGRTDPYKDDYLMVRLLDTTAIMETMAKLRDVYPNVLHIEKPGLMANGGVLVLNREKLKRSELDIFADFYSEMRGEALSEEQRTVLGEVITTAMRHEQGAV